MFAQPYPREFLCCICHAKSPISSSTPPIAREVSWFAFCIQCLSFPRPFANQMSLPADSTHPGTRHRGVGASSPGWGGQDPCWGAAPEHSHLEHVAVPVPCGYRCILSWA